LLQKNQKAVLYKIPFVKLPFKVKDKLEEDKEEGFIYELQ
jgi:hypothetical protein